MTYETDTDGRQARLTRKAAEMRIRIVVVATGVADTLIAALGFYIAYLDSGAMFGPAWIGQILMGVAAISFLVTWFVVAPAMRRAGPGKDSRTRTG